MCRLMHCSFIKLTIVLEINIRNFHVNTIMEESALCYMLWQINWDPFKNNWRNTKKSNNLSSFQKHSE